MLKPVPNQRHFRTKLRVLLRYVTNWHYMAVEFATHKKRNKQKEIQMRMKKEDDNSSDDEDNGDDNDDDDDDCVVSMISHRNGNLEQAKFRHLGVHQVIHQHS